MLKNCEDEEALIAAHGSGSEFFGISCPQQLRIVRKKKKIDLNSLKIQKN
jgi:hypothetical protein